MVQYFEKESAELTKVIQFYFIIIYIEFNFYHNNFKVSENNNEQISSTSGLTTNLEYRDIMNNNEESIECIDLSSDEEESESVWRNYSSDQTMSKSILNSDQNLKSSFGDVNNQEEMTENILGVNYNKRKANSWTDDDSIRLIFIVNKVGRHWKIISKNFKNHFRKNGANFLRNKYFKLKENEILFKNFVEKSKQITDVTIINNLYSKNRTNRPESLINWTENELIYLVHGVSKFNGRFEELFKENRSHFHESRTLGALRKKYSDLKKDTSKLLYLKKKASLLFL